MTLQRLADYGTILVVIAALMVLFRVSRFLLGRLLPRLGRGGEPSADRVIQAGMHSLLSGMILLPLSTAALAAADPLRLTGGVWLHLALVAVSVVLFSFAEDLFGSIRRRRREPGWTTARHFRAAAPALLGFWAAGTAFLSPIFYSALTLVLAGFLLFAVSTRPAPEA